MNVDFYNSISIMKCYVLIYKRMWHVVEVEL